MNQKVQKDIVNRMIAKHGKKVTKPEEDFPIGFESHIEMPTRSLDKYLQVEHPEDLAEEIAKSVESIYDTIATNTERVRDLASKTRVIGWKKNMKDSEAEVSKILEKTNATLREIR
ncbi:unnamed protein product [Moneuplotes crassus]|uniref:Uncharacterized protein n=2 Tax=Euplotes crassus TaxID=5936 RepID=A0AAD1Y3R2_EUPCR|nr:unnamed protein product [Moneuplotes crassus]